MTDLTKIKVYASWMAIDIAKDFNAVMVETHAFLIHQQLDFAVVGLNRTTHKKPPSFIWS